MSTTRLLGRLSNNLAFVTKPQQRHAKLQAYPTIWLSPRTGVAIVVTSLGVAAQSLFEAGERRSTPTSSRVSRTRSTRAWRIA